MTRPTIHCPTVAVVLVSSCWMPRGMAQTTPVGEGTKIPSYVQATAALRDKLPGVAVVKLLRALDGKLKTEHKVPVLLLLAESLVRAGRAAEAVTTAQDTAVKTLPEAKFWLAQAQARLGNWREAEAGFDGLTALKGFRYAVETAFSHASMLAALGDLEKAGRVIAPLRQPVGTATAERAGLWLAEFQLMAGNPAAATALLNEAGSVRESADRSYLRARIALVSGDSAQAAGLFAVLSDAGQTVSPVLAQAARLGRVRALRMGGKSDEATPLLRQLISARPVATDEMLDLAFQELEALNQPPSAEMESFLNSLASGADAALKIRARLALAASLENIGAAGMAGGAWAAIQSDFPEHPLRVRGLLRQAQFLIGQKRREEAKPLLAQISRLSPSPAVAAWAAWAAGQAEYDAAAYQAASGFFKEASVKSPDQSIRAAAAYNAALAELQSGGSNPAHSLSMLEGSPLAEYRMAGAEFHLERALRLASLGQEEAVDGLTAFVDNLPDHPRRFDALIARAEITLRADPPRGGEAAQQLAAAREAAREPWQIERAALLGCYIAEATTGPEAFATRAQQFLTDYPQSGAATDLRMKLAQSYYRRENFSGARHLFEAIADGDPLHPLAEPALFWAGRSALLSMEPSADKQAVVLWEKVFKMDGPMKWQARLQEARLNQNQRKPAAALQLLDEIVASSASPVPDVTTRWQALSMRGEILVVPGSPQTEQAQGLACFDGLINTAGLPSDWRRQTLVRKGVCLEAIKRPDEALEAYYDVLSDPPAPLASGAGTPDDYWFHRAGDKARRLLEGSGKYEEAIEIAKKMAQAPGPRGRAAAELVDELALKYGIWTSSP